MGQTAEELLNSLTEDQIAAYTADPASEEHIIVGADRIITVPDSLKRIAVQFDHNIETVTFDCPRYWDGHDMSKMAIYINYMRQDNVRGSYAATNVTIDETDDKIMHFDWTISGNVTEVKGNISFLICIKKTDDEGLETNHWNSELNQEMGVSQGLECEESIFEQYPDLITQLLLKMDDLGQLLVVSDDGNGNVNIEGLNTTLNIANSFSDKAVYAVGDYAMHYGTLYKCIVPVDVPGLFVSTSWVPVNIVDELKECFQYVSDGKTLIASAIIDMGVQTEATDTFNQMAINIRSIQTGVSAGGTAEVGDVTAGKTFINHTGQLLTGTSTVTDDFMELQEEHTELQSNYDTVVGEKEALQTSYTALSAEYDNYVDAVVHGLQNSGLGVTEETTAKELETLLLSVFPEFTMVYSGGTLADGVTIDGFTNTGGNLYAVVEADMHENDEPKSNRINVLVKNIDLSRYSKMEVNLKYAYNIAYGWGAIKYGIDSTQTETLYKSSGWDNSSPTMEDSKTANEVVTIDISSYTGTHYLGFMYDVGDASSYYSSRGELYISQIKLLS